jgi:DNA polymerase
VNYHRIDFHYDLESRSHVDLTVVGPVNYWAHPSSEVTRITWKFSRTGPVKIWRPLAPFNEPIPVELIEVAKHPERYNFIAWNILFDYLGWICWMLVRVPGSKRPELKCLNDAMALSCHFRTGASLEAAAKMFNLPVNKDPVGRAIMMKQCKPNSRTGQYAVLTAEEEAHFDRYSMIDTRILADVWYMMPPLPEPERYAWSWTFRRNLEGIRIDLEVVEELSAIVQSAMPPLEAEFAAITGGLKINSHEKVRDWFKQFYPHITSMDASNIRDLLIDTRPVPPYVRRALEIKDLSGSSSVAKLPAAKNLHYFGRIYELLAYHHAGTKRWAGRGIQIQNFPRVRKRPDDTKFDMNVENLAAVLRQRRPDLKDPIGFVKNLLRRIWLPDPGEQFYCGDFAKVEPSVLFWLCDLGPIPKMWYETMAAAIYNKRPEEIEDGSQERTIGKIANLSCQYGTGGDGYRKALHKDTGIVLTEEEGKRVVSTYRRENPRITQFWSELETAFRLAIFGQVSSLCRGRVHFIPLHLVNPGFKGVAIRLPSGSHLFYHQAEEVMETFNEEVVELRYGVPVKTIVRKTKKVLRYKADMGGGKIGWKYVYGGKLCENVVSATARDVIVPATWQLENAGFKILGLIHDEIWGSSRPGRDEEFKHLMCINPSWCDMPISSDLKVGVRYLK